MDPDASLMPLEMRFILDAITPEDINKAKLVLCARLVHISDLVKVCVEARSVSVIRLALAAIRDHIDMYAKRFPSATGLVLTKEAANLCVLVFLYYQMRGDDISLHKRSESLEAQSSELIALFIGSEATIHGYWRCAHHYCLRIDMLVTESV